MSQITRFNDLTTADVVFTDSQSTTGGFNLAVYGSGLIMVTATSTGSAVTVTFGARTGLGQPTFFTAANSSNSPVTLAMAPGRCYAIPSELLGAAYVTGTAASGATVTCTVHVKA